MGLVKPQEDNLAQAHFTAGDLLSNNESMHMLSTEEMHGKVPNLAIFGFGVQPNQVGSSHNSRIASTGARLSQLSCQAPSDISTGYSVLLVRDQAVWSLIMRGEASVVVDSLHVAPLIRRQQDQMRSISQEPVSPTTANLFNCAAGESDAYDSAWNELLV